MKLINSNLPRYIIFSERLELFKEENLIKNSIKTKIHRLFYHFIENNTHTFFNILQQIEKQFKKFSKILFFNKDYKTDKFKFPALSLSGRIFDENCAKYRLVIIFYENIYIYYTPLLYSIPYRYPSYVTSFSVTVSIETLFHIFFPLCIAV